MVGARTTRRRGWAGIACIGVVLIYLGWMYHYINTPIIHPIGPLDTTTGQKGDSGSTTPLLQHQRSSSAGGHSSHHQQVGGAVGSSSIWYQRWDQHVQSPTSLWPVKSCLQSPSPTIHNAWSRSAASSQFGQTLHKNCNTCYFARNEENTKPTAPWFCKDVVPAPACHAFDTIPFTNVDDTTTTCSTTSQSSSLSVAAIAPLPVMIHAVFCAMGERFQGPGGQSYVVESIRQWRMFHPIGTSTIHLIVDQAIAESDTLIAQLIEHEKQLWAWGGGGGPSASSLGDVVVSPNFILHFKEGLLKTSVEWRRYHKYFYVQGYMHPGGSRTTGNKQFNQLVSERFFAVEALMRTRHLTNIIHLENDMMVYDNFVPMVHAALRCGYGMATTVIHIKGVIPSVLYVRSADALGRFTSYLTEFLRCGKGFGQAIQKGYANDMTYLKNFYQLYGNEALGLFPTWRHKQGELCINSALGIIQQQAATVGGDAVSPLIDMYGLIMERIVWQARRIQESQRGGGVGGGIAATTSLKRLLPSAIGGGVLMDGASFGQWYSAVAVRDPTYLFFTGLVKDIKREAGNDVLPPTHIRNSVTSSNRFLDATPPQVMTWELYLPSVEGVDIMVPAWSGFRITTLHIHQKNLGVFNSLHARFYKGMSIRGINTNGTA